MVPSCDFHRDPAVHEMESRKHMGCCITRNTRVRETPCRRGSAAARGPCDGRHRPGTVIRSRSVRGRQQLSDSAGVEVLASPRAITPAWEPQAIRHRVERSERDRPGVGRINPARLRSAASGDTEEAHRPNLVAKGRLTLPLRCKHPALALGVSIDSSAMCVLAASCRREAGIHRPAAVKPRSIPASARGCHASGRQTLQTRLLAMTGMERLAAQHPLDHVPISGLRSTAATRHRPPTQLVPDRWTLTPNAGFPRQRLTSAPCTRLDPTCVLEPLTSDCCP